MPSEDTTNPLLRRIFNRLLHSIARNVPGGLTLRPFLHKLRGVKIHGKVWIGDDVYLDNEHPHWVEIHEGAVLSLKCIILAHTKGPGQVIIERDAFIGPLAVVACTGGKVVRIGEGALISAGAIITSSVPAHTIMAPPKATAVGWSRVPYYGTSLEEFIGGLEPLRRRPPPTRPDGATAPAPAKSA